VQNANNNDPISSNETPGSVALDGFNYVQVNFLKALTDGGSITWDHTASESARVSQIQGALGSLIPNFLDTVVNQNGVLADTNTVVRWTLSSVLSAVGGGSSWRTGTTPEQVAELSSVLNKLVYLPTQGVVYAGVAHTNSTSLIFPNEFFSTNVDLSYPSAWPTNETIVTYLHFVTADEGGVLDDYLLLNGHRYPEDPDQNCMGGYSHNVTNAWYRQGGNVLEAWDRYSNMHYLADFQIVHVLKVPAITVRFEARPGEINHGFDPTEVEPWTSVGVGRTNEVVQLVVEPASVLPYVELVAVASNLVSVTPQSVTQSPQNLTIYGLSATSDTKVELRWKPNHVPLSPLHTMVLMNRTLSVGIYRIEDPISGATRPVGGPPESSVINTLNQIYKQTCITFSDANTSSQTNSIVYDGTCTAGAVDGKLQDCERPLALVTNVWAGQLRVFFFKNSGISYSTPSSFFVHGVSYKNDILGIWLYSIVFADTMVENTVAHELGHQLGLAAKNPDSGGHDTGATPAGVEHLMKSGQPVGGIWPVPTGQWLRHEDWQEANSTAGGF
jgi:hypothetical protein